VPERVDTPQEVVDFRRERDRRRRERFLRESAELADALEIGSALSHRQAVERAIEYRTLMQAIAVTRRRANGLRDQLIAYIETHGGEAIEAEGMPRLRLVEARSAWFDLVTMKKERPDLFAQLLDLGWMSVLIGKVREAVKRGQIEGISKYEHHGRGAKRLVFDDDREDDE